MHPVDSNGNASKSRLGGPMMTSSPCLVRRIRPAARNGWGSFASLDAVQSFGTVTASARIDRNIRISDKKILGTEFLATPSPADPCLQHQIPSVLLGWAHRSQGRRNSLLRSANHSQAS